ncbi:TonB-dependent receptor [Pseudomonas sp. F1_0610]|uniref:TonB-dependent receptor plug domain-containing protein n=1 Tax=Pseudomonas sp. F1_0610 TaxID=3114284 RepID=UPI0039C40E6E
MESGEFKLPSGFHDYKNKPTDTGNYRKNADYRDKKGSFKLGLTPNDTDEYVMGYSKQEGDKNQPAYTGKNKNEQVRFWRWPQWDKESIYFLSSTQLNEQNTIKTRVYRDDYKNTLRMYDDAIFASYENSPYQDKTYGAALEWINTSINNHELHIAVHYKDDRHQSADAKSTKDFRDVTRAVAIEDLIRLAPTWRMRISLSHEERSARKAFSTDYPNLTKDTTRSTYGLLEVMHDLSEEIELFMSVAKKTRMPTLKDRFSARMGKAYANPNLKPEAARHAELGVRGNVWTGGYMQASVFYSHVRNEMQFMPYRDREQLQNTGKARHRGLEISLDQSIADNWQLGAAYTYLNRVNLTDRSIKLTDTLRHKLFTHATWRPIEKVALQATVEVEAGRRIAQRQNKGQSDTYTTLSGFTTFGLKSTWNVLDELSLEAGVRNLTNKNYAYADGYPQPSRTWFAGANYTF